MITGSDSIIWLEIRILWYLFVVHFETGGDYNCYGECGLFKPTKWHNNIDKKRLFTIIFHR